MLAETFLVFGCIGSRLTVGEGNTLSEGVVLPFGFCGAIKSLQVIFCGAPGGLRWARSGPPNKLALSPLRLQPKCPDELHACVLHSGLFNLRTNFQRFYYFLDVNSGLCHVR